MPACYLEKLLEEKTGSTIMKLKISLNNDHTSTGCGYAIFTSEKGA